VEKNNKNMLHKQRVWDEYTARLLEGEARHFATLSGYSLSTVGNFTSRERFDFIHRIGSVEKRNDLAAVNRKFHRTFYCGFVSEAVVLFCDRAMLALRIDKEIFYCDIKPAHRRLMLDLARQKASIYDIREWHWNTSELDETSNVIAISF
tara:strand:- start:225 stop:674 length:450 start_codon:yes stop_codon:yes gene_type:complete